MPIAAQRVNIDFLYVVVINANHSLLKVIEAEQLHDSTFTTTTLTNNANKLTCVDTETYRLDYWRSMWIKAKTNIFKLNFTLNRWQSNG